MSRLPILTLFALLAAPAGVEAGDASDATRAANAAVLQELPFSDRRDFDTAQRGFIAPLADGGVVAGPGGRPAWDLGAWNFITADAPAPPSVNPSLWRQTQLLLHTGLFKVVDGVYQVRGLDLSNLSIVEGTRGVILIDPCTSSETARAALDLYYAHRPKKPVTAVIYSHSHVDHYGGVKGVVSPADVAAGKVKIIAPEGFMEEAVKENVMAGNAMARRASYMYGSLLPAAPDGRISSGLGLTTPSGTVTLIAPTDTIRTTGTRRTIDGVEIVFQMAPHTEAPAEMLFYFPKYKALCVAEDVNATLHNIYTLRGAQVRDALAWSRAINEAIVLFGDQAQVTFGPHHWPHWGDEALRVMRSQRDTYKFIHDQTLRLANHGYTMLEIAEMLKLPDSLGHEWYNRGYYGTVNHNAKAVYQRYLGFFDGNPANLHPLPPAEAARHYVEFMGGADAVLAKARESYARGEYRWVAQVVNHVVFAEPDNQAARALQADALEQLGFQAESGPWRNFYLMGARELRDGVKPLAVAKASSPDTIEAMTPGMLFDYLAVRLDPDKAAGRRLTLNINFSDLKQRYLVTLDNSTLNYLEGRNADGADATIALTKTALERIQLGTTTLEDQVQAGAIRVVGQQDALPTLLGLMDDFPFWFNIVTPNPPPGAVPASFGGLPAPPVSEGD